MNTPKRSNFQQRSQPETIGNEHLQRQCTVVARICERVHNLHTVAAGGTIEQRSQNWLHWLGMTKRLILDKKIVDRSLIKTEIEWSN